MKQKWYQRGILYDDCRHLGLWHIAMFAKPVHRFPARQIGARFWSHCSVSDRSVKFGTVHTISIPWWLVSAIGPSLFRLLITMAAIFQDGRPKMKISSYWFNLTIISACGCDSNTVPKVKYFRGPATQWRELKKNCTTKPEVGDSRWWPQQRAWTSYISTCIWSRSNIPTVWSYSILTHSIG